MKWNRWFLGMMGLNSSFTNRNKSSVLNDAQILELMAKTSTNLNFRAMELTSNIFNWTEEGFNDYMAVQYRMFGNFVGSLWDYDEKFIDAIGIGKYDFETRLIGSGELLLSKNVGKKNDRLYLFDKYEVIERDYLGNPIKVNITINETVFSVSNFVIIKANPQKWNKIIENSGWYHIAYRALCEIYDNISNAATKYLMLTKKDWNNGQEIEADALNEFIDSYAKIANFQVGGIKQNSLSPDYTQQTDFEDFKNSLLQLEFKDRLDNLWETYFNAIAEAKELLGIPSNKNAKKRERQITGEIDIEGVIPNAQRDAMFYERQYALNKLGYDIMLIEGEEQDEEEDNDLV